MILPQEKTYGHIPVLPKETVEFVMPYDNGIKYVVDGTVGYGGHSELILRKNPHAFLLGLDRDENVLPAASERLDFAKDRVILKHSNFSRLRENVFSAGWSAVDAVLLDIGVSSPQIDTPGRGFSFRFGDSPLDMRMNPRSELNAEKVLNTYSEQELTRVFREYGEFPE